MTSDAFTAAIDRIFADAIEVALPHLQHLDLPRVQIAWCQHRKGNFHFIVLFVPDGPMVGVQPLDEAAEAFLLSQVPRAAAYRDNGVSAWANAQPWKVIASTTYDRVEAAIGMEADHACDID